MTFVFYVLFVFLVLYGSILLWLASGFLATKKFVSTTNIQVPFTIIICARNEEKNITICLRSLLKQDYDRGKIQLILVNDVSTDHTVQRAEVVLNNSGIQYRIISNKQQKGKKQSIEYAMQFAANELVLLRDADTFTLSTKWLQTISDFYQSTQASFIIAPVSIANHSGILWALQAIENNVLSVLACGSSFYKKPFLCSGANLAFTKTIFEKAGGYASHRHIASGDDVLLLEDVKKIKDSRIGYLKSTDALVYTYPCFSFKSLIRQKTRWASKFKQNRNKLNLLLSILGFAVNLAWLFCFFYICLVSHYRQTCLAFIFLKLIIDILLLFLASGFIKNKNLLWFSLPVGCIYPVYTCIVGIASLSAKPKWK